MTVFFALREKSLGYESPEPVLVGKPEPNYTKPGQLLPVDIFKGNDSEDLAFKSLVMTKYTSIATGFFLGLDVYVGTRPKGSTEIMKRILYWSVPFIAGGLAYTTTVTTVASLRNKNTPSNHFIAGMAWGTVLGAARKKPILGILSGIGIGLMGVAYKESILYKFEIFPTPGVGRVGGPFTHKLDFSMKSAPPVNWVKGPNTPE